MGSSRMGFIIIICFLSILVNYVSASSKCCPEGQAIIYRWDICWEPKTNVTTATSLKCNETFRLLNSFEVNDADKLILHVGHDIAMTFETNSYCLENYTIVQDVNLTRIRPMALVCIEEEEEEIIDEKVLLYSMIISVIFLAATALIYTLLPELRDVQGKSIINFCISLGIGLLMLIIIKLITYTDMGWCAFRGFMVYYFLIASFFWSNAIAIQVLLNSRRPATLDYSWREFKWYMLYGWGCPTVLTICMAIVNFYPGHHQKPGIGLMHCWFYNKYQQWYYMYSIMSLLLAANICIFIYTSVIMWRLSFSSSHIRAVKFKFMMTVRLIILMGLPWVFEMIASLVEKHIIWAIMDVFNTLQGLLIFLLLVVFRKRVVKMMYKHGWLNCIAGFIEKHLATEDDEENIMQHTDVAMNDKTAL
ncbi:hypothetical protein PYW08_007621 [Mythimna loreyi]|uniref:Uncharacterized protein n=1 Tax=Mythimna loreyi TaxID=667449 RepID=A0ACC2QEW6_9NEOP|nr:hypothetical protein PYW08_007621 [Mythimna loreyi]